MFGIQTNPLPKPGHARTRPSEATASPSVVRTRAIAEALGAIRVNAFELFLKTDKFFWHMGGADLHECQLLLDAQADQLFAMTAPLAARLRELNGPRRRCRARLQGVSASDADLSSPLTLLSQLQRDNQVLAACLRTLRHLCAAACDRATAGPLENWICESERRALLLSEAGRRARPHVAAS